MAFEIYREPIYTKYYANILSWTAVYYFIYSALIVLLPLIIAYNSGQFWPQESVVYEQPQVTYQYTTILHMQGLASDGMTPMNLFYSTSPKINQYFQGNLRIPVFRTAELDDNNDGVLDRLNVGIAMPLSGKEVIKKISALFYYDVVLAEKAKYKFDAVSYVDETSPVGFGTLTVDGNVVVKSDLTLAAGGGYKMPYQYQKLIDVNNLKSSSHADIGNILSESIARDLSTNFEKNYAYSTAAQLPELSDPHVDSFFNSTIVLRVPKQPITYQPGPSEVLKVGWIQYLSFWVITYFFIKEITGFILRNRLLYAFYTTEAPRKKNL